MKRNVNVFIGVVLCAVLCGCFVWLSTASEDDAWSPNEIYNEVVTTSSYSSSYTNATFSASSGDGLALSMGSSSSLSLARGSVSYAGAYSGATTTPLTSNLSPLNYGGASGGGLYATSSAQIKSFGGGNSAGSAMGGSLSVGNGRSNSGLSNPSLQGGAGVGSISPITYTVARVNNTASADPATMPVDNPAAVMAANYGMGGYIASVYTGALMDGYQSAGMCAGAGSTYSSYAGITGRRNASTTEDAWTSWLLDWYAATNNTSPDIDGNGVLDDWEFEQIYAALANSSNPGMGMLPTEEDFREFLGEMLPVGDIVPLLLLALLYVLFVAIKSKSLKSLLKTERSE